VLIDDRVEDRLWALTDLAPLHQPKSLAALAAVSEALPGVPAVACFDTAFHASMPPAATTYALPVEWRTRWELRRYGFHGLSHAYAARRAAEMAGRPVQDLRIVSCHLGAGASLAAVAGGRSVDTTMGFTPLEGLVMATRSGSVDPGLVIWLLEHVRMPPAELASTLEHRSGLLGLAGTPDMRSVLASAGAGDPSAVLGRDVYVHRLRVAIASMTAAMGGLDVLLFTGGVGENAPAIRELASRDLGYLGIRLDPAANAAAAPDAEIGDPGATVRSLVIRAREDLEIVHEVRGVLGAA
jgi:acetate kinase